jgi:hypothetical protein
VSIIVSSVTLPSRMAAERLRLGVLHARFASIVTVGGYDNLEDPALRSMQNIVANQLRPKLDARIELFPQPLPMEVPH